MQNDHTRRSSHGPPTCEEPCNETKTCAEILGVLLDMAYLLVQVQLACCRLQALRSRGHQLRSQAYLLHISWLTASGGDNAKHDKEKKKQKKKI